MEDPYYQYPATISNCYNYCVLEGWIQMFLRSLVPVLCPSFLSTLQHDNPFPRFWRSFFWYLVKTVLPNAHNDFDHTNNDRPGFSIVKL